MINVVSFLHNSFKKKTCEGESMVKYTNWWSLPTSKNKFGMFFILGILVMP